MTAVGGQLMMQLHDVQHDSIKWLDRKHLKDADPAVATAEADAALICGDALPGCVAFQQAAQHASVAIRNLLSSVDGGLAAYKSIADYCTARYETADAVGRDALTQMIDDPAGTPNR